MRIRIRPVGFDARAHRPSSLRAQARRVYQARAERDEALKVPTPDPSPQGGGEQAVRGEGNERSSGVEGNFTSLTHAVRALYEAGAAPVREIARMAGVSERTIYKYVRKGGWRRRHAAQDIASAVRKRAALRKPRACVTAKGAGGRFVRAEDAGQPFARGLKALDPAGETRALARAERASALSDDALARTRRLREAMSDTRTMAMMVGFLRDLAAVEEPGGGQSPRGERKKPRRTRRNEWRAIGEPPLWADRRK